MIEEGLDRPETTLQPASVLPPPAPRIHAGSPDYERLGRVLSTQTKMHRELTDLRGRDARARMLRSAERLKASFAAQRKSDPLATFAKAEPVFDEAHCRSLLSNAIAANALTQHEAAKAEYLINQAAGVRLAKAMPTASPAVAIHEIIRTGDYAAIPVARHQR